MENLTNFELDFLREEDTSFLLDQLFLTEDFLNVSSDFPMEEGTSSAPNQVPSMEFGVPDIPSLEQLQSNVEVFPQVSVNPVDPYAIGLTDVNLFTMDEEFNPMDQGFPEEILTQDQIQMIHDDGVGFNLLNLDFSTDVQHQSQSQNQNQNEGVGGSHLSPQTTLSMETISQYFHLPLVQAAHELSVPTWYLRKRYIEEGLEKWPYKKLKSLQTFINNAKELGDTGVPGGERLKKELPWFESRRREILKSPNLPLGTNVNKWWNDSSGARMHRKRKMAAASSSQSPIQSQQQPVSQGLATSSSNPVGQQVTQHDEGDVIDDLLDNYMLFFPDDPQSSPSLGLFGV